MTKSLEFNAQNFFSHLIFHPEEGKTEDDCRHAWITTVILGILTAGTVHFCVGLYQVGCDLYENCVVKKKKNGDLSEEDSKAKSAARNVLKQESNSADRHGCSTTPIQETGPLTNIAGTKSSKSKELFQTLDRPDLPSKIQANPKEEAPKKSILEKITSLWKKESPGTSTKTAPVIQARPPLKPPEIWALKPDGQLDSKIAEKQFWEALQFLEKNPDWVRDETHSEQLTAYFIKLAKTNFLSSRQLNPILAAYQSIVSQHGKRFCELLRKSDPSLLVSLKIGVRGVLIPKNLLISQSPEYLRILESPVKNDKSFIDMGELYDEFAPQLDDLVSYLIHGKIAMDGDNVLALLAYAVQHQVPRLQERCLKFLSATVDVNDEENFQIVQDFVAEKGLTDLFIEEICRDICGKNFFGTYDWEMYFGGSGKAPPLPENILMILNSNCPIFDGKKVWETHMLVMIPEMVNNEFLTLGGLGVLVKNPIEGSGGHSSRYRYLSAEVSDECKNATSPSHWALITKDVLGEKNKYGRRNEIRNSVTGEITWFDESQKASRGKKYAQQEQMVAAIKDSDGNPLYEVPSLRDMVVSIFMHHVGSGECLFNDKDHTSTHCKEFTSTWGFPLGVTFTPIGAYTEDGMVVTYIRDISGSDPSGMAASRRL